MQKLTEEDRKYLVSKGWTEDTAFSEAITPWRWRQPGMHAKFTGKDAIENQHALDKEAQSIGVQRRNQKGIKGS